MWEVDTIDLSTNDRRIKPYGQYAMVIENILFFTNYTVFCITYFMLQEGGISFKYRKLFIVCFILVDKQLFGDY